MFEHQWTIFSVAHEHTHRGCATAASDVYSFGVCVLHACAPDAPVVHDMRTHARVVPESVAAADSVLANLLAQTLAPDPSERPTAAALLGHDFFSDEKLLRAASVLSDDVLHCRHFFVLSCLPLTDSLCQVMRCCRLI